MEPSRPVRRGKAIVPILFIFIVFTSGDRSRLHQHSALQSRNASTIYPREMKGNMPDQHRVVCVRTVVISVRFGLSLSAWKQYSERVLDDLALSGSYGDGLIFHIRPSAQLDYPHHLLRLRRRCLGRFRRRLERLAYQASHPPHLPLNYLDSSSACGRNAAGKKQAVGPVRSWQEVAEAYAQKTVESLPVKRVTMIGQGAMRKLIRRAKNLLVEEMVNP